MGKNWNGQTRPLAEVPNNTSIEYCKVYKIQKELDPHGSLSLVPRSTVFIYTKFIISTVGILRYYSFPYIIMLHIQVMTSQKIWLHP